MNSSKLSLSTELRQLRDVISEAIAVNWCDVMPDPSSGLIHIDYEQGNRRDIEWLKVWSSIERGRWNLVCEYWMDEHRFGETGFRFANGYSSVGMEKCLNVVMQNQTSFILPPPEAHGLIQVSPPGLPAVTAAGI